MLFSLIKKLSAISGVPTRVIFFLCVGACGLLTDLSTFTVLHQLGVPALVGRVLSLACATCVTWILNRTFTFESQSDAIPQEAARYVVVTLFAQGLSYATFAILVLTQAWLPPQAALIAGAAIAAVFSFQGHKLFSFASTYRTSTH